MAEYRTLAPGEHPKTDVEKWDQWMTRYSKRVQRNLGPFFVKWKIPVTGPAREAIRNLPSWMHPDFAALGVR
ncbi:MAG: M60 family metallopeptidase [Thermoguttaceae bacterium]